MSVRVQVCVRACARACARLHAHDVVLRMRLCTCCVCCMCRAFHRDAFPRVSMSCCASPRICARIRTRTCVRLCACALASACLRVYFGARPCACNCMFTWLHAWLHVCMFTCFTCLRGCEPALRGCLDGQLRRCVRRRGKGSCVRTGLVLQGSSRGGPAIPGNNTARTFYAYTCTCANTRERASVHARTLVISDNLGGGPSAAGWRTLPCCIHASFNSSSGGGGGGSSSSGPNGGLKMQGSTRGQ